MKRSLVNSSAEHVRIVAGQINHLLCRVAFARILQEIGFIELVRSPKVISYVIENGLAPLVASPVMHSLNIFRYRDLFFSLNAQLI